MNEKIIELAKKAGFGLSHDGTWLSATKHIERLVDLVRKEVEDEWIETNKALAKEIIELRKVDPDKYADHYGKPPSDEELSKLAQAFGGNLEDIRKII